MSFGDNVTLINRTTKMLSVRFDGRDYPITPGRNESFPRAWVGLAKTQNPLMGSEHPFNPTQFTSLVGVEGTKDDCSPLEQSDAPQRVDRSGDKRRGRKHKVIEADGPTTFDASMPGAVDGFSNRA